MRSSLFKVTIRLLAWQCTEMQGQGRSSGMKAVSALPAPPGQRRSGA